MLKAMISALGVVTVLINRRRGQFRRVAQHVTCWAASMTQCFPARRW
jgi:hypothetical protein